MEIKLMINPTESCHKELIETIIHAMQSVYEKDGDIRTPLRKLTDFSQAILKREWERVKKVDELLTIKRVGDKGESLLYAIAIEPLIVIIKDVTMTTIICTDFEA